MTAEGCVGCVSLRWVECPVKRMNIHALANFVAHSCNCRAMFPSVDGLRKHWVRCRLFTDLYGQTDNLYTPIFVVCSCRLAEFLRFLEDKNWDLAKECPAFSSLLPVTRRTPEIQRWLDRH